MAVPFARTTRALSADGSRVSIWVLLCAMLAITAWFAWFSISRLGVYEVSQSARLEAGGAPYEISSKVGGTILTSQMQIGDEVEAGTPLAALDAAVQQLDAAEQLARLDSFPTRISALKNEIAALQSALQSDGQGAGQQNAALRARIREAEADVAFARENAARLRRQSANGGVAEIEAERAKSAQKRAEAQRDALIAESRKSGFDANSRAGENRARLEVLRSELATLQSEEVASQAASGRMSLELDQRIIRAPVSGILGDVLPLRPGSTIAPGQKIATIIPKHKLIIVASYKASSGLGRIRPGQRAEMRLDGFPWTQFGTVKARVLRVAAEARGNTIRVELEPLSPPSPKFNMRHGLTGQVEILIEKASPLTLMLRAAGLNSVSRN